MIKLESIEIHEFRGIRDAALSFRGKSAVVAGPNGTGKSGVVDAIQFALTGEVTRLTGEGSRELSVARHGPHVDVRDSPGDAWVSLKVYIPSLSKTATITRTVKRSESMRLKPDDPEVKRVIEEMGRHSEVSLSRRDIIKFILTQDGKRSSDVQALLRLEIVGETRALLKKVLNKAESHAAKAETLFKADARRLGEHLGVDPIDTGAMIDKINVARGTLGLQSISALKEGVLVDLPAQAQHASAGLSRDKAIAEVDKLLVALSYRESDPLQLVVRDIGRALQELDEKPSLAEGVRLIPLFELGLEVASGDECPLCGTEWKLVVLKEEIRKRIRLAETSRIWRTGVERQARELAVGLAELGRTVEGIAAIPEVETEDSEALRRWGKDLVRLGERISKFTGVVAESRRLTGNWLAAPEGISELATRLRERISHRPADTALASARDLLVVAADRLTNFRKSALAWTSQSRVHQRATILYDGFVVESEQELLRLYKEVENDFATSYRLINAEDEGTFTAQLSPDEARLSLSVDFYGRGPYPPGAYHSEGHQDGMGICLYLALVKQAMGADMKLVVLDDVVMSIDAGHRRRFCELLKSQFPEVQFIITTHDEVWARQLASSGVVDHAGQLFFDSWDIESGPVLQHGGDVWARIATDLGKNDVSAAAARLRRHLEFEAREMAHELGASVRFKADARYDLGDLFEPVVSRQGRLLDDALAAARSWERPDAVAAIQSLIEERKAALRAKSDEQWLVNQAVHFNEWKTFHKNDFLPIRDAFRELLSVWTCKSCGSRLRPTAGNSPSDLRCQCDQIHFNLVKRKP